MSTLFLFGAGASYGSDDERYTPPLGNGDAGLFRHLVRAGGLAATVDRQLAERFEKNFEDGMGEFFRTRNREMMQFMRELALYFTRFCPRPGNLYRRLIADVGSVGGDVVLSTTNYDMLIEAAAGQEGRLVSHRRPPLPDGRISLLKIHGSIHFLPDLEGQGVDMVDCFGIDSGPIEEATTILEAPVRLAAGHQEVIDYCRTQNSSAPAIAVYAPGKRLLTCRSYVEHQQMHWRGEVERVDRIVVIGLRVNDADTHIWSQLRSARAQIGFVGFERDEFMDWSRRAQRPADDYIGTTFKDAYPQLQSWL